MGSKGQSLLFLAPHEREYIDVLVDRGAGGAGGKPLVLQELALAPQVRVVLGVAAGVEKGGMAQGYVCGERGGGRSLQMHTQTIVCLLLRPRPLPLPYTCPSTPARPFASSQVSNLFDALRDNALKDRDLYERGLRAYVSIVRAYREHLCDFIFRLNCFDFAGMATALGLLQVASDSDTPTEQG